MNKLTNEENSLIVFIVQNNDLDKIIATKRTKLYYSKQYSLILMIKRGENDELLFTVFEHFDSNNRIILTYSQVNEILEGGIDLIELTFKQYYNDNNQNN